MMITSNHFAINARIGRRRSPMITGGDPAARGAQTIQVRPKVARVKITDGCRLIMCGHRSPSISILIRTGKPASDTAISAAPLMIGYD